MPRLVLDALEIPSKLHPLPKNPEKVLFKFDPNKNDLAKDHVNKFMLEPRLMNVEHEDVVF